MGCRGVFSHFLCLFLCRVYTFWIELSDGLGFFNIPLFRKVLPMKQANTPQNNSTSASITDINSLKAQFLKDMELAGLASASRRTYLDAVEQLIKYYWCSPADLTESQVNDYLLERHRQNPAKGTFKVMRFALRFFFQETVGRDWHLFKKK
jgi:hypothetical protein